MKEGKCVGYNFTKFLKQFVRVKIVMKSKYLIPHYITINITPPTETQNQFNQAMGKGFLPVELKRRDDRGREHDWTKHCNDVFKCILLR